MSSNRGVSGTGFTNCTSLRSGGRQLEGGSGTIYPIVISRETQMEHQCGFVFENTARYWESYDKSSEIDVNGSLTDYERHQKIRREPTAPSTPIGFSPVEHCSKFAFGALFGPQVQGLLWVLISKWYGIPDGTGICSPCKGFTLTTVCDHVESTESGAPIIQECSAASAR